MSKGVLVDSEAPASAFKSWKAALIVGGGLLLAVACTPAAPVENDDVPSGPTDITTPGST